MQRCKAQAKGESEKAQSDLEAMEKRLNETRRSTEATKRRLEAEEKNLMIDLNAEPDRNKPTGLNKARQAGVKKESERSTLCNGEGKASEVEQLRNQLKDERREHRRALLDIRTLIDRHIAKVKVLQHSHFHICQTLRGI